MKKAVVIFAHNLPEQLNLFTRQLISDGATDVFIHISKKNEEIKKSVITNEHVFITDRNITTTWGSDELLKAILIMIDEVLTAPVKYEYILICSGQDLLVRKGLDAFLETNNGRVYIDGKEDDRRRRAFLLYKWPSKYRQLINHYNFTRILRRLRLFLFMHGWPFGKKKTIFDVSNMTFFQSYFWCALPRDVAEFIHEKAKDRNFMSIYEGGLTAEEGFLLTVLMNSQYSNRVEIIDEKTTSLTFVKPFRNNHPPIIDIEDIKEIEESGVFFARKFSVNEHKDVVEYYTKMFED